jgi:hypothetical protein
MNAKIEMAGFGGKGHFILGYFHPIDLGVFTQFFFGDYQVDGKAVFS